MQVSYLYFIVFVLKGVWLAVQELTFSDINYVCANIHTLKTNTNLACAYVEAIPPGKLANCFCFKQTVIYSLIKQ